MRGHERYLLVLQSFVRDDIFLALRGVEVDGKLDSLGLVDAEWQIRLLLQIFQTEAFQVLFGKRLRIQ